MKHMFPLFLLFLFFLSGCRSERESENNEDARKLFVESAKTIQHFIKEIEIVNDSSSVDSLTLKFEKKLVDINFSFPPETDLKLTEQENDSLFKMISEFRSRRELRLKSFNDTIIDNLKEIGD